MTGNVNDVNTTMIMTKFTRHIEMQTKPICLLKSEVYREAGEISQDTDFKVCLIV